jgi:hypothetical protein
MFENQTLLLVIIVLIIVVVVGFIVASILMDESVSESEAGTVTLVPLMALLKPVPVAAAVDSVRVT